jgi:O-antigen/teichoic acid export membrane protein
MELIHAERAYGDPWRTAEGTKDAGRGHGHPQPHARSYELKTLSYASRWLVGSALALRSGLTFAVRVGGVTLTFAVNLLFARALGAEQYGTYVYWVTLASMVATLASFGTPAVVVRQIAAARGQLATERLHNCITYGSVMLLVSVGALLLCGTGLSTLPRWPSHQSFLTPAFIAFLGLAVGQYTSLATAVLLGFERIIDSQLVGLTGPLFAACGAFILWLSAGGSATAVQALLLTVLAGTAAAVATTAVLLLRVPLSSLAPGRLARLIGSGPAWFRLGVLFALNQVLVNAITQIDILMLGWLSTSQATAHYYAGSRISYIASFFFASVAAVTMPTIARLHAARQKTQLAIFVQKASLLAFAGTLVLAVLITALGDQLLGLFGSQFLAARKVVYILMSTFVIHAFFGPTHALLTMAGATGYAALGLAIAALANVALNAGLIPGWGAEGAAMASLISTGGFTVLFWAAVRRRYGFRPDAVSAVARLISEKDVDR